MRCPDCHQEHAEGTRFCPMTGKQINMPVPHTPDMPKKRSTTATITWLIIGLGGICSLLIIGVGVLIAFWSGTNQTIAMPTRIVQSKPISAGTGKILFVSNRDGNSEIYVMEADGSNPTRLTKSLPLIKNDFPTWSPDGKQIAFVSTRDGTPEIHLMNADGGHQTRLTEDQKSASSYGIGAIHPAWSPDGTKLAFVSYREGGNKICILLVPRAGANIENSVPTCLAGSDVGKNFFNFSLDQQIISLDYESMGVTWSANGEKLVYSSSRSGNSKIYQMNSDGSDQNYLINDPGNFDPCWSPDGQKIAFVSRSEGGYQIFVANADGSLPTMITHENEANSLSPSWSADAQKIAFTSNRDGNYSIYSMNADGSGLTKLTEDQSLNWNPSWSR